ncbi:MAG: hypothetical protein D6B28_03365 [Gammaproteobacteria bacterium]|nr:MAG: hypothetical protein D6B28_03365 [Gammaproteobacteria bacterium]
MIKISWKLNLSSALLGIFFAAFNSMVFAQAEDSSEFFDQKISESLAIGQSMDISVTFKNTSSNSWSSEKGYKLVFVGADEPETWGISAVSMPADAKIELNGLAKFEFTVTAPSKPGIYKIQWQMTNKELNQFGEKSPIVAIAVSETDLQAKFVSQLVPNTLKSNSNYKVTLQYQNTGSSAWSNKSGFSLIPATNKVNKSWGISSVQLPANRTTAPGEFLTLNIPVKTPKKPGTYPFQWQIAKNGTGFGDKSPVINVRVESGKSPHQAEIVFQRVPKSMKAGNQYDVAVVVKNTGTSMWTADSVSLVSQAPARNLDWFINNVEMQEKDMVLPGNMKSFAFKVVAPQKPGIYNFQWQLHDKKVGFFGPRTPYEQIRVTK